MRISREKERTMYFLPTSSRGNNDRSQGSFSIIFELEYAEVFSVPFNCVPKLNLIAYLTKTKTCELGKNWNRRNIL